VCVPALFVSRDGCLANRTNACVAWRETQTPTHRRMNSRNGVPHCCAVCENTELGNYGCIPYRTVPLSTGRLRRVDWPWRDAKKNGSRVQKHIMPDKAPRRTATSHKPQVRPDVRPEVDNWPSENNRRHLEFQRRVEARIAMLQVSIESLISRLDANAANNRRRFEASEQRIAQLEETLYTLPATFLPRQNHTGTPHGGAR